MKLEGKLLQIAQLGNPVLRQKTEKVEKVNSSQIKNLIKDMMATVMDVDGVGIAAPQVYVSRQLFIIASHPNARYPKAPLMAPTAVINPRIVNHGKGKIKDWEGCLSLPGVRGLVPRWKEIKVEFTNEKGKIIKADFEGFLARIFQHEYDHLYGIVFLDRVEDTKEIMMEKEYLRLMADKLR